MAAAVPFEPVLTHRIAEAWLVEATASSDSECNADRGGGVPKDEPWCFHGVPGGTLAEPARLVK